MEIVEGPLETCAAEGCVGVDGEDGYLLVWEGWEGALALEGGEAAVVGEYLDISSRVFLDECDQIGDIAEGVVFAAAGGTYNRELRIEN